MIERHRPLRVLVLAAYAATATPYMAQAQQVTNHMQDRLAAAGFEVRPAYTTDRQDMLSRLRIAAHSPATDHENGRQTKR